LRRWLPAALLIVAVMLSLIAGGGGGRAAIAGGERNTGNVAPPNDNFAGAFFLSWPFSGALTGTTVASTGETGEPVHNGEINSVWYAFTPATTDLVTFDTCTGTSYDSYLAAYVGASVDALTQVAANDDACGL